LAARTAGQRDRTGCSPRGSCKADGEDQRKGWWRQSSSAPASRTKADTQNFGTSQDTGCCQRPACEDYGGGWPFAGFGPKCVAAIWSLNFGFLYYAAIILQFVGIAEYSWHIIGLVCYLGFGLFVGLVRNGVRLRFRILHGDLVTDILCGIFVPMFAISQMEEQMSDGGEPLLFEDDAVLE